MRSWMISVAALALVTGPALAQEKTAALGVQQTGQYAPYLTDGDGRAVYMFEADTRGQGGTAAVSNCYEACAEAWPPLLGQDPELRSEELQKDLLGTIERKDGQMQVTYNGWPLYYFVRDEGAGSATGQDIEGFGAEWYLLRPSGEKVEG